MSSPATVPNCIWLKYATPGSAAISGPLSLTVTQQPCLSVGIHLYQAPPTAQCGGTAADGCVRGAVNSGTTRHCSVALLPIGSPDVLWCCFSALPLRLSISNMPLLETLEWRNKVMSKHSWLKGQIGRWLYPLASLLPPLSSHYPQPHGDFLHSPKKHADSAPLKSYLIVLPKSGFIKKEIHSTYSQERSTKKKKPGIY